MLSEIIRFTLRPNLTISAQEFLKFRQKAAAVGATAQYYGYTASVSNAPLPRKRHEVCWVINWPDGADRSRMMSELRNFAEDARSLLFHFPQEDVADLERAFEAPFCEFACVRLSDDAPLSSKSLQASMDKTYRDTFGCPGFTGGHWAYAINTNDTDGVPCHGSLDTVIPEGERRLGVYYLGWESTELHQDALATPKVAEELNKLMPFLGPGSGAWYAMFKKHISSAE